MKKDNFISIVIPVYNEEENLEELVKELKTSLKFQKIDNYEIILVDDGSEDKSWEIIRKFSEKDKNIKGIRFTRNFGQTSAIYAGFQNANGDIIITLDADLQNDPSDIKKLIKLMEKGYDVVSGWRKERKDPFLTRILPSKIANWIIGIVTGVKLHDYGCTLKAYKKEIVKNIKLYGEMHRFLPALAHMVGAKITEIPVNHRERKRGKSKYGLSRTFKVILDLFTVKFLGAFQTKPIYLFGGIGIMLCFIGILFALWTLYDKIFLNVWVHKNPKILISFMFFPMGVQFILMGLIAELLVRAYFESQDKKPYIIKEKTNC